MNGRLLGLMCWVLLPPILVSFGLVGLKRLSAPPPWLARLRGPPFYRLVLSVATLVVGTQVIGFIAWLFYRLSLRGYSAGDVYFIVLLSFADDELDLAGFIICLVAFWTAMVVGMYVVWRRLRGEGARSSSRRVRLYLKTSLALAVFTLAFLA